MIELRPDAIATLANEALEPLERALVSQFDGPKLPPVFVVGSPRSGTTLLAQLLINRFRLGYINNVLARFWLAPAIAAYALQPAMAGSSPIKEYTSEIGSTGGPSGPHEFGWFWRRWFRYGESHEVPREEWSQIDVPFLRQELAGVEHAFQLPVLYKNPAAISLQISFLAHAFPNSLFINCRRDPLYTAQSLLLSRLSQFGCTSQWFSTRPPEYKALRDLTPPEQVAGQVFFTERRIHQQLTKLDASQFMELSYEELCSDPVTALAAVQEFLRRAYPQLDVRDLQPLSFRHGNRDKLPADDLHAIRSAHEEFHRTTAP